jgi:2-keto-4-pentenoate hydratase
LIDDIWIWQALRYESSGEYAVQARAVLDDYSLAKNGLYRIAYQSGDRISRATRRIPDDNSTDAFATSQLRRRRERKHGYRRRGQYASIPSPQPRKFAKLHVPSYLMFFDRKAF